MVGQAAGGAEALTGAAGGVPCPAEKSQWQQESGEKPTEGEVPDDSLLPLHVLFSN